MAEKSIKKLLEEFRTNKKVIEQLRASFTIDAILDVAFKEKMYDVILDLFKPIELESEIKMYFDIFSYLSPISMGLLNFIDRFDVSQKEKDNIIKLIYSIDIEKLRKMKIGNTLPRQISGWGHPVASINDVIYTECVYGESGENGICCIWIDYDSLSEENRSIANRLISMNAAHFVDGERVKTIAIRVPCNRNETVGVVSERLKSITKGFIMQPILYGFYPKEQMLAKIKESVKNDIYNDHYLPDGSDTYFGYCLKLIASGKVQENPNGNLQTEDGKTYLIDDFVNVILSSNEFIQSYIVGLYGFYYDEAEDGFWQSEELYKRHVASLNQINSESIQLPQDEVPKKI